MSSRSRLESQVSMDAQPSYMPSSPMADLEMSRLGLASSISDLQPNDMQAFIDQYRDRMTSEEKIGYYDVMILYAEDDRELAESYKEHLQNDIMLEGGRRVTAVLYDDQELVSLAGSKIKSLDFCFQRCTFAFIYLTKKFCQCEWSTLSSEECLMESIYNPKKKWCVVPVYTVSRAKADFKIPMGLNALKGVNFYNNDDFYRRGLRRLIGDKVSVRLNHNSEHFRKQYMAACRIRNEDIVRRKTEEALRRHEELKLELLRQEIESKKLKENMPPSSKLAVSSTEGRMTDSMVIEKQRGRLQEYNDSRHYKKSPVESGTDSFGSEVSKDLETSEPTSFYSKKNSGKIPSMHDEEHGKIPRMHDEKHGKILSMHGEKLTQRGGDVSMLEMDYSSESIVAKTSEQIVKEYQQGIEVHHYHHFPEGPGRVTQNYNIANAENVAIGKNATIVSTRENDKVIDEEENRRNSLRSSGSFQSVDGGLSTPSNSIERGGHSDGDTQAPESVPMTSQTYLPNTPSIKEESLKNDENISHVKTVMQAGPSEEKTNISRDENSPSNHSSMVKPNINSSPNHRRFNPSRPIKPLPSGPVQNSKPVVATISPMVSMPDKPSSEESDTVVKTPYRGTDPQCTDVKRTQQTSANSPVSDDENTDLKRIVPPNITNNDPQEETKVKQIPPVNQTKPLVVNEKMQGCCKPNIVAGASPPVGTPEQPVMPSISDSSDIVEDCPGSETSTDRDSAEYVTVHKEDVELYSESLGTDVDSGFKLTEVEKGLDCVKKAMEMGYSKSCIKQALIKLRARGKTVDINSLLDEMHRINSESTSPESNVNLEGKISKQAPKTSSKSNDKKSHDSKSNDTNTRQKPGIFQKILNNFTKGGN
ncbi:uncharacterized protein LOC133176366 isoform X2 [Saccostrea echinata]|uniref:uncharacterized protein LOC133176366 isoform X2 n=1 Tax=Saccostrea echinata TaxID=191078 RepID=UPI002A8040FC|nr:uncharacterized protein LOC133176366 isoform X2 [Saccostrea echinata]